MKKNLMVTYWIVGLCIAVYLVTMLVPQLTGEMMYEPVLAYQQPWRYLTAAFQHGDFLHLLCNMGFLYMLGLYAENLISQWKYLGLFLVTALGGSVGTLVWCTLIQQSQATVGASGATMGICAALFVMTRRFDANGASLGGLLLINVLIGFIVPGVAWHAHLGGAITGLILGAGYTAVGRKIWSYRQAMYRNDGVVVDIVDRARLQTSANRWGRWGFYAVDLAVLLILALTIVLCYSYLLSLAV